uniref:Uncharacterized protein n=1 Tax=Zea mays TaxID=4577 RepID=C0HFZ7_MAIZE|nr:unknown [Zea mays]
MCVQDYLELSYSPRLYIPEALSSSKESCSSASASVKVRALCSFFEEKTSTSAMYTAVTGR